VRVAENVPGFELAAYQKTVRALLRHPLMTAVYPDDRTLRAVRRWGETLQADLVEMFGYRLEMRGHTARLVRVQDGLDASRPATVRDRPLDRQRYAYLALALSVLGRAGIQITLGEMADAVASDASRISGLGLDPDRYADRRAFVDAVMWLEDRGALRLADGSASSWASDPTWAEALYDIARDVIHALYRPNRVLQHIGSVGWLLDRPVGTSENALRRAAGHRARRLLVERPVVYFAETDPAVRNHLRSSAIVEDLERLTGLRVERRAEGVLLVDTVGFTDARFPGTGAVTQAALLLLGRMADRVIDPDARKLPRVAPPTHAERQAQLIDLVDRGLPAAGVFAEATADLAYAELPEESDVEEVLGDEVGYPFVSDSFLRTAMKELMAQYGTAFGERWRADPNRLRTEAVEMLADFRFVEPVDGGVVVLPLTGRYRNVDAKLKRRRAPAALFNLKEGT